ncbi:reverse transcriptase domain-containing protein, partial [Tanacetum coccineum]
MDTVSSKESGTALIDHLSDDDDEEVLDVKTKKIVPAPKKKASKMFDESFFTSIFNGLPRDDFDDSSYPKIDDQDKLGDHWPIHDPKIKWKHIRPHLGERYEGPEQLKSVLTYYALANGYKLYFEVNNPRRLVAKCSKDNQEKKCLFRLWAKDHYGMLWSYAAEILNSNEISTCKVGVDVMPDGKAYFSYFYMCFKALKEGWLEGCRRVIGLNGCFLKTLCKGELLSVVGRDGNNQIYQIAWAVVSVQSKENWSWFMQCLIDDIGIVDMEG